MSGSSMLSGAGSIYGAYANSKAIEAKAEFDSAQAEINAKFAEQEAKNVLEFGDKQAAEYRKKVSQFIGTQKASAAGAGVDVGVGSAAALREEAAETGALDIMAIKNNAWRQAFGLRQESTALKFQSRFIKRAGKSAARATLIGGGFQAASSFASGFEGAARPTPGGAG